MLRILFFASDNTIESGAFNSMTKLCSLLKNSGKYEPVVVLPNRGDGYTLLEQKGIKYYYVRSCRWIVKKDEMGTTKAAISKLIKRFINSIAYIKLVKLIQSLDVDIVHINTLHTYVGAKVAIKLNKKLVWHFRELLDEDQGAWFWDDSYELLLNKADCCIAISEYVYNRFKRIVAPGKMKMISNGIDESDFYTERVYKEKKKLSIVCVGNINGHKGHETLIKACDVLVRQGVRNFSVDLVGAGVMEQEYKKMCHDLLLDEWIVFNGRHRNVKHYYDKSDVMIMGSDAEAFGRTTVEAMMSGCVIVGSDSGATPSIIGHGEYGYLFKKGDVEGLADIIKWLIKNPEEAFRMAMRGQQYALKNYTAMQNAKGIMQIYERISTD